MKNKKTNLVILAFLIVSLLILSSFTTYATSNINYNENKPKKLLISIKTSSFSVSSEHTLTSPLSYSGFDPTNNVVSNTSANESYPSMVVTGYKALCSYDFYDGGFNKIYLRNSFNYGQSWSSPVRLIAYLDQSHPDIEIKSSDLSISPLTYKTYGSFISPLKNAGIMGYYDIDNIGNLNDIATYTLDWTDIPSGNPDITYDFWNFKNPSIVSYNSGITPWAITLIGSTNYTDPATGEGPCTNSLMFCFRDLQMPEQYVTIAWFPEIQNCKNVVTANDYNSNMIYGVCEKQNGTNQDLLFFKGNPNSWYYGSDILNTSLTSPENLLNPQIYVKQNNIYIVAETDTQGIILFKSTNAGINWNTYPITSSTVDSKYPLIYGNNTGIFCTFIQSENISITSSTNGTSWDAALQLNNVNESVHGGYRQSDLPDENHVVWTDKRDGNKDIYMVLRGLPEVNLMIVPESVNISTEGVPFLKTKNRILFTVKNTGSAYVEDLYVYITYNCIGKDPKATDYPAYIYYLDGNGAEISFDRPLFHLAVQDFIGALRNFINIQNITITVETAGKYEDINPEDNSVTIPVTYAEIFPILAFIEDILG